MYVLINNFFRTTNQIVKLDNMVYYNTVCECYMLKINKTDLIYTIANRRKHAQKFIICCNLK